MKCIKNRFPLMFVWDSYILKTKFRDTYHSIQKVFEMIQYYCDRCGQEIKPASPRFTMKMELFASKDDLYFTEADLQKDLRAEMEQLIRQMENMDAEQLTDEVHVRFEFDMCGSCRKKLYQQFRRRLPLDFEKIENYN
jgi:hypothetical protein